MDTATEKLIVDNMKLVPFIFHRYYQRFLNSPFKEDLMELGYIGLVRAAKEFDGRCAFTTWAAHYIRREMNRYFMKLYRDKRHTEMEVISLDAPAHKRNGKERESRELYELISDSAEQEFERIESAIDNKIAHKLLSILNDRERKIVRMYFGFDGEPMSTAEIGKALGISRQRVSMLVQDALKKMRYYLRRKGIRKSDLIA